MLVKYQLENFSGCYDFRCGRHRNWIMESHLHAYSEILYCQKGVCSLWVNGKQLSLPAGHLVWLFPHDIHQFRCLGAEVVCAVFSQDYIPAFFDLMGEKRLKPTAVPMGELTGVLDGFDRMTRESILKISGYLLLIAAKVLEHSEQEQAGQADQLLYRNVVSYISAHFREPISLKTIAREFGYNEKYLSHALYGLTGIHFSRLIALYRVEHAKKLLRRQQLSMAQIAAESGFAALNSFNRSFKALTGMTPSAYKKR